jgi:hypothetical protein
MNQFFLALMKGVAGSAQVRLCSSRLAQWRKQCQKIISSQHKRPVLEEKQGFEWMAEQRVMWQTMQHQRGQHLKGLEGLNQGLTENPITRLCWHDLRRGVGEKVTTGERRGAAVVGN